MPRLRLRRREPTVIIHSAAGRRAGGSGEGGPPRRDAVENSLPILVFREADIAGGVFDNGVSDVFVHPIPSPDITGTAIAALKQVFQRWAGKVREHYYDDKRA